jgi:uncharacterized flavoprotein (TIGR03862 family)
LTKKTIAIIGGGAAALLFAATIETSKYAVTIYEKNKALGRKFLVAGDGGFNLTHAEPLEQFIHRYTPHTFLHNALLKFSNTDFIHWLQAIGIHTFVGTSKRIYPVKGIKPIAVLNAILQKITANNVTIVTNSTFTGWDSNNNLVFDNETIVQTDYTVFALGGGSWKVTGTNSEWLQLFNQKNIKTKIFLPSNCAYVINWDNEFSTTFAGTPLKNIHITCNDITKKGEVVITKNGLEGGAIYALSTAIRNQLLLYNKATITIDLKPVLTIDNIIQKLQVKQHKSITDLLKNELKLPLAAIQLLKNTSNKETYNNPNLLAVLIKNLPLTIVDFGVLNDAISTVGGIELDEVNENFELKNMHNSFVIGEMLNWDAPTGGYLLQGCVSMGYYVAQYFNNKN